VTPTQLQTLHALLEATRALDPASEAYLSLEKSVAHLAKSAKKKRRLARKRAASAKDVETMKAAEGVLHFERACYVCKRKYRQLYDWLPLLCPQCGERSRALRHQPLDLRGRRALLTGGRVKIGYATALKMLRAGAEVHVTTRFPRDAERRYAAEADFASWSARLHVHGLDFRDLGRLLATLDGWKNGEPFDIVINNAAQTVWHPPKYFEALREGESPESLTLLGTQFDALDVNRVDSWVQDLGEIAPVDMVEAQVVNSIAPFLICNQLRANLRRSKHADRFVINVAAVEGQFGRPNKLSRHPHTNMAKAGLNMLTLTSAADLAEDRIFIVSVDPGWMSSEGAHADPDFRPPLTAEDCAARVLHPIAQGLTGAPLFGVLLKDFEPVRW